MPMEFPCPQCHQLLRTPDGTAGRQAKCPQCSAIVDVPTTDAGPTDSTTPTGSDNPFAAPDQLYQDSASADVPGSTNPYAAPTSAAGPQTSSPFAAHQQLITTQVSFTQILNRTWTAFTDKLVPCLLFGLVLLGVQFGSQIVGMPLSILQQFFMEDQPILFVLVIVAQQVWGILVGTFISCLAIRAATSVLRRHPEPVRTMFGVMPYYVRALLAQFVFTLLFVGVLAFCALPAGAIYATSKNLAMTIVAGVAGTIVYLTLLFPIMLRMFVSQFLIVDQERRTLQAINESGEYLRGNLVAGSLVAFAVSLLGTLFAIITCCVGIVFTMPFFYLTLAVIYLSITGQWEEG